MIDLTLELVRGRTGVFAIAATKADGSAQDFTDAVLWFHAYVGGGVTIEKNSPDNGITIDDVEGGLATLQIEPADTLDLSLNVVYTGPCELTMVVGSEEFELGNGMITVSPNVDPVTPEITPDTWSYSGNPLSSAKDEVRFLIDDTKKTALWTLQDNEINYALALYSDNPPVVGRNFLAAKVCAELILGKYKIVASSKTIGDLSISQGNFVQYYADLVYRLGQRATLQGVKPSLGGSSKAQKWAQDQDTDRVQPAVKVDEMNINDPMNPFKTNPGDRSG